MGLPLLVFAALLSAPGTPPPRASAPRATGAEAELPSAIEDFEFGEHAQASRKLQALLEPLRLTRAEDVIVARQYLGACYFLLDQRTRAEAEFAKTLALDPEHKLDPEVFSPAIVQFFEDVRSRTGLSLRPREEPRLEARPPPPSPPSRPALALAFIPFGVGQFANDQPVKGTLFAVGETGLFATAAIGFALFEGLKCPAPECRADPSGAAVFRSQADASQAANLQTLYLTTLYAGLGVAVVGIVDALISRPAATSHPSAGLRIEPRGPGLAFVF